MQFPKQVAEFFRECGRKGGKSTTAAKAKVTRENGKKGGRPKKVQ